MQTARSRTSTGMRALNRPACSAFRRWAGASVGALLVTLLLFRVMVWLVPQLREPAPVDLVALERIPPLQMPQRPQTSRRSAPLLKAPPELPPVPAASGGSGTFDTQPEVFVLDLAEPGLVPKIGLDTIDLGEPIPLIQISPNYPLREWTQGVEGYVDIRMDIGADGIPDNLQVVDSRPGEEFVPSALRSVSSWRYAPVTVDGQAVRYEGYVVRIAFALGAERAGN